MRATATLYPGLNGWAHALERLDFEPARHTFRRDGLTFRREGSWALLETTPSQATNASDSGAQSDPGSSDLGRRGLWKTIQRAGRPIRLFELSWSTPSGNGDGDGAGASDEDVAAAEDCVRWALETLHGDVPPGWVAPPAASLETMTTPDALTLRVGGLVRRGAWTLSHDRLALRFPLVTPIPADLPPTRRQWLERVAREAHEHFRLVRIGFSPNQAPAALMAEIDLTGAPAAVCDQMILASLDSLKWAAGWLIETADFLADAALVSDALAIRTHHPSERNNPCSPAQKSTP